MEDIKLIVRLDPMRLAEEAAYYDNCGADELYYYDEQSFAEGCEEDVKSIKTICRTSDIPLNVMAKVLRFEDVKKMIYAGAKRVIIDTEGYDNLDAVKEASDRFGAERIYLSLTETDCEKALIRARKAVEEEGFGGIVLQGNPEDLAYVQTADFLKTKVKVPVFVVASVTNPGKLSTILKMTMSQGIIIDPRGNREGRQRPEMYPDSSAGKDQEGKEQGKDHTFDCMDLKAELKKEGLPVNLYESSIAFDDFKLNSDGMIPCITQDYKSGEVLMLAYMTRESFEKTLASGKMCYFSRSRQELWTKGDTSGHYQYVKSLSIDCDNDTLLARVAQVGAACHTGNRSCFYRDLMKKEYDDRNPLAVFEEVYDTILDRKEHPKEGSYTNYLFDKGVDKILKKVGEEATEIVIAAKNPDSDELKYEICDFLYHMMVLMAEQDVSWKEITDELATRH